MCRVIRRVHAFLPKLGADSIPPRVCNGFSLWRVQHNIERGAPRVVDAQQRLLGAVRKQHGQQLQPAW